MKDRFLIFGISITVLGIFIGHFLVGRVLAVSGEKQDKMHLYTEALSVIQENYVDDIESRDLIYSSIRGMMSRLDPHSNFLDPKTYSKMKEDQKGSFFGLGITVAMRQNDLTVISPIQGTPADRAGIRAGDIIEEIEGEPTRR